MGLFDFLKKKPGEPDASSPPPPAAPQPAAPPPAAPQSAQPQPKPASPSQTPAPTPASTPASTQSPAGKPAAAPAPAANRPAPPEHVDAIDSMGRRVRMPREEYRAKVLPELIKANGNDAERLTGVILQGIRDGFAADLVAAANKLTIVDKDPERCLSILAVVQRDSGDLDAAEGTLKELQQKRPQSPGARVGLAMIADQRGDTAKCESLLWEALQIDSNHADAVHGYLQVRHRTVGDAGHRAEIEKVAALPGSWRAQLWLARLHLVENRVEDAVALYRDVLGRVPGESDALVMASGDLARANRHDLVVGLIGPLFLAGRHHPHAGLALLHSHLQQQNVDAGTQLLHQMYLHYGHMLGDQLHPYTAEFDRIRLAKLPAPPAMPQNPRLGLFRFDRPLWCAGLDDPLWLLPQKGADSKQVVCMALSVDGAAGVPSGREEEIGRLTRAVPLLLAEHVWLSTPHRGVATLPMAEHGGWAVVGRPWTEDQLIGQFGDEEKKRTILVTGVLRVDGDKRRIDLWAYDCATKQRVGHAAAEGNAQDIGKMLLQLMAELWPALGGPKDHKPPVGDDMFWARYLDGLGQHAALVVTQAGAMPKERLYGERYVANWLQSVALQETRWQPGFWLYASSLCVLHQLGSVVPKEHARVVAELFRQSPPNTAFALLGVRPLRAVGLDGFWNQRRPEILQAAGGNPAYLEWLKRAEAAK